jgi:hypothetical protein
MKIRRFPERSEGKLLDLTPYFKGRPDATLVKNVVYRAGDRLMWTGPKQQGFSL